MKIINNKYITLLVLSVLMLGCAKDYLDEPVPTDSVTEEVVFTSREGVEAYISGVLRLFRRQYQSTDSGGLYSMYFARTVKGNDIIQAPTWYLYDYDQDNREPTYRRTVFTWQFPYDIINHANVLINGIENSSLSDTDKQDLIGQAYTLRAFYYFQLALEFQHAYGYDTSLDAPPLYTTPSSGDTEGNAMSTMADIYTLIVSDLQMAIDNLSEDRIDKSYININVANGILARVYLAMGNNWSGAEAAASAAIGDVTDVTTVLDPDSYGNGFGDISNTEWIWGMPQRSDQTNYYYAAPSAFTDHHSDAYYGTYVNNTFVAQFSDTDVRNTFEDLYGAPTDDYRHYVTNKFDFASFTADIVIMRTAEMILIQAEAKYMQGDETGAHNLLYALQSNRDVNAVMSSNTGADLLEEILLERRKELYGEMGVEWFDAKRLRRGIVRDGNHRILKDLDPDDTRFFLKVPQREIDANPNIDASVNANR